MAAENMSDWAATPATINEAVWAAKQYLDDLFDRYETWDDLLRLAPVIVNIFKGEIGENVYQSIRAEGVGGSLISRLLGSGWAKGRCASAATTFESESAQVHANRLRAREERQKARAEQARLEADRLKEEAAQKAQQEQERKAKAEARRLETPSPPDF